jgi:Condensation domain
MSEPAPPSPLAPLQRVMLRDSLAFPRAGHHVEQVEIRFSAQADPARVVSAWRDTVAATDALRMVFLIDRDEVSDWKSAKPNIMLECDLPFPGHWDAWLTAERCRDLLVADQVPWRSVFWPKERRFVWTFHHALLDGRSITRVLRAFLDRVEGRAAPHLALSRWLPPDRETKAAGEELFRRIFVEIETPGSMPPDFSADHGAAVRCLGAHFAERLDKIATSLEITTATLLIAAWGQALAKAAGTDSLVVEQLRAGVPQEGTAGFTLCLLPLPVRRVGSGTLRELRARSLDLRRVETMAAEDFPPGVFPEVDGPWGSVIMIERGTLQHLIGERDTVASLSLHERQGDSLMATAHLQPDLRLEVEGPGRHELLDSWIDVLVQLELGNHSA